MTEQDESIRDALKKSLLSMADDELILAQRNAEWTGHAPILEEDIAFANIAQDELGHATIWYQLLEKVSGDDPDQLVFFRSAEDFRNCQLFELPNEDWSRSIMRQFLFDAYELVRCRWLMQSSYEPLSHAAAKIKQEEIYHYRHTSSWIRRLGWGTEESGRKMQQSLDFLWPYVSQLFVHTADEELLVDLGYIPSSKEAEGDWEDLAIPYIEESNLVVPRETNQINSSRSEHTHHLQELVSEMQEVARIDPLAQW